MVNTSGGEDEKQTKTPGLLVELKEISGMDRIQYGEKEGLKIGAMVSLRNLAPHPVIKEKYPVLARAASMVGTVQLQAMGTLGGNLCQDNCCVYFDRPAMWREGSGPCFKSGGDRCHAVKTGSGCRAVYSGDMGPGLSCMTLAVRCSEKEIQTIEGLSRKGELHPLQQTAIDENAVQCGYCTPGWLLSAKVLLDNNPKPSREEIKTAIAGNLCRCTGYKKFVDAVMSASGQ